MPRKSPLSPEELEILSRLKAVRRNLELPRRLFAKRATLDSSIIIRLELGRMPLRFGIARALCNAHSIDAEWLATGEGSMHTPFGMATVNQIRADENALFSEVFKNTISPSLWDANTESPLNSIGRAMLGDEWSQWVSSAFEKAPIENLNALDSQLRTVLETLVGPVAEFPKPRQWLRQLAAQKKKLTKATTPVKDESVHNQWHGLKSRIQKTTAKIPGGKSTLAKFLGVDLTQLSKWLTDSKSAREPGADYTLKMLQWVQEHESQQ